MWSDSWRLHKVILTLLKTQTGSVHTISSHSYNHVMTILCVILIILTDLKHSCITEYITKPSLPSSKLYYPSSGWFFTPNWQRVLKSLSDRLIKLNLYAIMMINDNVLHWYIMIMSRPKVRPYYGKCKFRGNIR